MHIKKRLVVVSTVLITLIALLVAVPAVAGLFGVQYRIVTTGSMDPTYPVGSVLVVLPPTGDDLRVGEPVVFRISDDPEDLPVTHRVVALDDGVATTRGDANDANDPDPLTQDRVVGTVGTALLGDAARAFVALTSLPGRIALIALALLLYALPRLLPEPKTSASDSPPPTTEPLEAS